MTTLLSLVDGAGGRPGPGSSVLTPPTGPAAASGGWLLGTMATLTGGTQWLYGYDFWVAPGGDTAPAGGFTFATWNVYGSSSEILVPGSTAAKSTLTADTMNRVLLATPIQVAPGEIYVHAVGWTASAGIPLSSGQFGSGNNYAAGITNGPLVAWPNTNAGGTNPFGGVTPYATQFSMGQGLFSNVLGSDPTAHMPNNASGNDFFWISPVISSTAPAGFAGSSRLHPNAHALGCSINNGADTVGPFTLGLEFSVNVACTLDNIWFYSDPAVTVLPTAIGLFQVSGPALVNSNSSPSWSGSAGAGWVSAAAGWALQPGVNYKAAVLGGNGAVFNYYIADFWEPSAGFGGSGLTAGPVSFPSTATAASPGQASYNAGATLTYPSTNAGPYDYLLDVEVTPVTGTGMLMAAGII